MKRYKAVVVDRVTKQMSIVELEQVNIDAAMRDIRANGYNIFKERIKVAAEFDRIMNETNGEDWDWHPKKYALIEAQLKKEA